MSILSTLWSCLPDRTRLAIVRSKMRFAEQELADVLVKEADCEEELLAASHIVHRVYIRRGLVHAHPSGLHVTPHSILPTTRTFVAKKGGRYIGALSLIGDAELGLPMDNVYGEELTRFRARGERLAEVGSLGLLPQYRSRGVVSLLYRLLYETARDSGVDRLVAAVHPDAEDVYRACLLFERCGDERLYPGLNRSARAVAITLELPSVDARFERAFGHLPETTANPRYVYLTGRRPELVPSSRSRSAAEHARLVRGLVVGRNDVFAALPWERRADIRRALPDMRLTIPDSDAPSRGGQPPCLARLVPA